MVQSGSEFVTYVCVLGDWECTERITNAGAHVNTRRSSYIVVNSSPVLLTIEMAPLFSLKIGGIKFCENPFSSPQVFFFFFFFSEL